MRTDPPLSRATLLPRGLRLLDARSDIDSYLGRSRICAQVLGMEPMGAAAPIPSPRLLAGLASTWENLPGVAATNDPAGGHAWTLDAPNGLPVVIRTRAFGSREACERDARAMLQRLAELELVAVRDRASGRSASWVMLGDQVVLVSGRVWRRSDGSAERTLTRVLERQGLHRDR